MRKPSQRLAILAVLALFVGVSAWFAPGAFADNTFTIAVIPDTQNYVDNTKPQPASTQEFNAETQYLAENKAFFNLVFVTHVGDVVQNGDGTNGAGDITTYGNGAEWNRGLAAMQILADAGIPFGMSIGNHDYDNYAYVTGSRPLVSTKMWVKYFGSKSSLFAGKPWYGGASDNLSYDPGLSSYQTFQAGGKNFLHISLQMEASDAALAWAQGVVSTHPGYATIVTTHSYMSPPAAGDMSPPLAVPASLNAAAYLTTTGSCTGAPQGATSPGGCNSAQQVWDKFISKNDQIFLVICGHSWNSPVNGISQGENIRIDNNLAGHPVYQVLTDYQGNLTAHDGSIPTASTEDPGGDGYIRLMQFNMDAGTIHFSTYSPIMNSGKGKAAGLDGEDTFNQPAAFSDFYEEPMPIQVLKASSVSLPGNPKSLNPGLSALAPLQRQ